MIKAPDAAPFELAREHAVADVPVVELEDTKADILALLTARRYSNSTHIAVCRDGAFLGIIRIEDLLPADPGASAEDLMDPDPPRVENGMDQEIAAWKAVQHRETALAVVD